ncbi:MAG: hypothetical protein Q7N50_05245 [Armatimonadota bacterium]|nr:hypothetical protein [Armatimonadota bacterium]
MISLLEARALRTFLPVVASVLAGAIGGFLVDLRTGYGPAPGLLLPILAGIYGIVVGDLLGRASRSTGNPKLGVYVTGGLIIGGLGGRILVGCLVLLSLRTSNPGEAYGLALVASVFSPATIFNLAIAVFAASVRIRAFQRYAV